MASGKEYLNYILEQLSGLEEITYRAMMGEFILYYRGKIVGGIYDDRLLVKPVKAAVAYMPTAIYELPYAGAKEMLLVDEVDKQLSEAGEPPVRREGLRSDIWVLMDFGCVIVHVFTDEARKFYNLERLWSDAEVVDPSSLTCP